MPDSTIGDHVCLHWTMDEALDQLADLPHRQLLSHWSENRNDETLCPMREDLDPARLGHCMKDLQIVEKVDAEEFRYRLIGTRIVEWTGQDHTGKRLDEVIIDNTYLDYLYDLFAASATAGSAVYTEGSFTMQNGVERLFRRLSCPVTITGNTVDQVFTVLTLNYHHQDHWGNIQWPPLLSRETSRAIIDA